MIARNVFGGKLCDILLYQAFPIGVGRSKRNHAINILLEFGCAKGSILLKVFAIEKQLSKN
jgi:hypothetical protein